MRYFLLLLAISQLINPSLSHAEERFVAVGYGGRRMLSTDGLNWKITAEWAQPGGDDSNNLMSAVYAKGKFVAVGGGGGGKTGAGHILVSSDGKEWKEVHSDKSRINPIVFGNDRFVVGTSSYPSGKFLWSSDGEKWDSGAAIELKGLTHFRGGAYGNGVFVFVGNGREGGKTHWAVATTDGEKIVSERDDLPGHGTIVFGARRFLMLTSHSDAEVISSVDGAEWKPVKIQDDARFSWLAWTGKQFIVGNGKSAFSSTNGTQWQPEPIQARGEVKWSDGTRYISSSWPGKMAFSLDGTTWKDAPPLTANGINVVVHAPE